MRILGCDVAKKNSDSIGITLHNVSVPMGLQLGEEYFLPEYQRNQMGLKNEDKLIVVGINKNQISLLVKKYHTQR